jgi:hypothetical protein
MENMYLDHIRILSDPFLREQASTLQRTPLNIQSSTLGRGAVPVTNNCANHFSLVSSEADLEIVHFFFGGVPRKH